VGEVCVSIPSHHCDSSLLKCVPPPLPSALTAAVKMERDSTVRRIRAQQNQNQENQQNIRDEVNAMNGFRSRKHKPEVSAQLLSETSAVVLMLGFVCVLWVLVLVSVQQLVISRSTGQFNSVRARYSTGMFNMVLHDYHNI